MGGGSTAITPRARNVTPINGYNNDDASPSSSLLPRQITSSSGNIERQEKMEDEYYQPTMHWADHNQNDSSLCNEEVLDDGDLPSVRMTNALFRDLPHSNRHLQAGLR